MERDDEWERRRGVLCSNCGAANWAGTERCESCGVVLGESAGPETVIDVSSGEPRVVAADEATSRRVWTDPYAGTMLNQGRVIVARGGRRTCLILLLVTTLLSCCVCWVFWTATGNLLSGINLF